MKLLASTKSKVTKNRNGKKFPRLHINEVVLADCNIANNDYKQDSRVLYTLIPNKSFGQLLHISPSNIIFLKIFNSELSYIPVWLTDQTSKPLEVEDNVKTTLVFN